MSYFPRLVELLLAAPQRVVAGAIQLTPAEAAMLRACDFPTATADGQWQIPDLPSPFARAYPWLGQTVSSDGPTPGIDTASRQPSPGVRSDPAESTHQLESPYVKGPVVASLTWRLRDALRNPDQRRILKSLLNCPRGRIRHRQLRKRLRRLATREFHVALDALLAAKIVTAEAVKTARWVAMPADVREACHALGLGGGRHSRFARALTQARQRTRRRTHEQPQMARQHTGQHRGRHTLPARPTDRDVLVARRRSRRRKPIPPPGTPEWTRHMSALKGAYASHQACLARGIVQTAKATQRRLAKRQRQREQPVAAPRHVAYHVPVTPSTIQTPGNAHASVSAAATTVAAPGTSIATKQAGPSYGTAAAISAAFSYSQPIGRRERLTAERNRR